MRKFSAILGFVCHAMFTVLGVIAIQAGVWWLGVGMIGYAVGNVSNELLIMKQQELLELCAKHMEASKRVSNN